MRALKFRAYGKNIKEYMREATGSIANVTNILGDLLSQGNWVIEQYIGLKDKNGKEIYEGDIISGTTYGIVQIAWDNDFASFVFLDLSGEYLTCGDFSHDDAENCEVIGDIHELKILRKVIELKMRKVINNE